MMFTIPVRRNSLVARGGREFYGALAEHSSYPGLSQNISFPLSHCDIDLEFDVNCSVADQPCTEGTEEHLHTSAELCG